MAVNAIKMLVDCFTHQARTPEGYLPPLQRCDCGAECPIATWQCATCALRRAIARGPWIKEAKMPFSRTTLRNG